MRLKEIEKLKKKELQQRVDDAFEEADNKGPAYLMKAQFYMRELEHRRDSWVSVRDLILEIVVIALIGWEIFLGYRQERWQSETFERAERVLQNLERSSAATASRLVVLQETSKQMNEAVQKELAVSYEVSLNVKYDITTEGIIITNEGRTSVTLWGSKVGSSRTILEKTPRTLTPGVPYLISGKEVTTGLTGIVPPGGKPPVPFVMFLKNERGEEFVGRYAFVGITMLGPLQIQPILESITQTEWSKKGQ